MQRKLRLIPPPAMTTSKIRGLDRVNRTLPLAKPAQADTVGLFDMIAHQRLGLRAIAGMQRLQDGSMFGHGISGAGGIMQRGFADYKKGFLQRLHGFDEVAVFGGIQQGHVKLTVERIGNRAGGMGHFKVQRLQFVQFDLRGGAGGKAGGGAFEHGAHLIKLHHLRVIQLADRGALPGDMGNQPIRLQLPDRLAHGGAADAQTLSQFGFAQPRAGGQITARNFFDQPSVGAVALRGILGLGEGGGHEHLLAFVYPDVYKSTQCQVKGQGQDEKS